MSLNLEAFILLLPESLYKFRSDAELMACQPHCFLRLLFRDPPSRRGSFRAAPPPPSLPERPSFPHTGFSGLLGNRLVRENPIQIFPSFDKPRDCDTSGFYLPVGNPADLHRLQAVLPESDLGAAPRLAAAFPSVVFYI